MLTSAGGRPRQLGQAGSALPLLLLGADPDRASVLLPGSGTHEAPQVIVYDLAGRDPADDDTLRQLVASDLPVVALHSSARRDQAERVLAMRAAQAGLTDRELAVLELIAAGLSNDQIAAALYITNNTVKSYVRTAYKRIGATSRSMAVIWALERGLGPAERTPATSEPGAA